MISLYTLFPDRLNLNGDQGNLLILAKQLSWLGVESQIVPVSSALNIDNLTSKFSDGAVGSFIFLGHGSMAAMSSIEEYKIAITELLSVCESNSVAGMVVGSSYAWLDNPKTGERISEFKTEQLEFNGASHEVTGYLNSNYQLPVVVTQGMIVKTLLHGPVLLKSSSLRASILGYISGRSEVTSEKSEELEAYVAEAIAVSRGERN